VILVAEQQEGISAYFAVLCSDQYLQQRKSSMGGNCAVITDIRELKQPRRQRQGKRHFKNDFQMFQTFS